MAADIKLTDGSVQVEGWLGVNEPDPKRSVHVTGHEIHSGGAGAGFSFSDRGAAFVDMPAAGERWVWYASAGGARLWSGSDHVTINAQGHVSAYVTSAIRPMVVQGVSHLGRTPAVWLEAQDVILTRYVTEDGQRKPAYEGDSVFKNFALSHTEGDVLVINRGGGFTGGVVIEGAVSIGGVDVAAELAALRAELEALKAKVQ